MNRELLDLPPADPAFLAWCAGLFEGEGSIGISKPSLRNLGALIVGVPNTQRDIVDPFHDRWGGYLRAVTPLNPAHNTIYRWAVRAVRATAFLTDVSPYIRSAKYAARVTLALEYQAQKSADQRLIRTPAYADAQRAYYDRMAGLNRRGRLHADTGAALTVDTDTLGPTAPGEQ